VIGDEERRGGGGGKFICRAQVKEHRSSTWLSPVLAFHLIFIAMHFAILSLSPYTVLVAKIRHIADAIHALRVDN
jgi:hypothetical protein